MSIETSDSDSIANDQTDFDVLPNPVRGCGTLKAGKAYIRSDVSANGTLPAFVEFAEPIPFKEDSKRSYANFPGIQFELSVTGEAGLTETIPAGEIHEHLARLESDRPTGETAGEMVSFQSHDLLLSVGKTHYPDVETFVHEARIHGVNKGISVTSGNEPPVVNPGRTRLFLIHPRAIEVTVTEMEEQEVQKTEEIELANGETRTLHYKETEEVPVERSRYVPGVFGYTYLTRVVYTRDADGKVPKYIQDYEATDALDIVEIGEPVPYSEQDGFDAEGNPVEVEQETFDTNGNGDAEAEVETFDLGERYPALPDVDLGDLESAPLARLAESEPIEGQAPPEGHDALHGDAEGAMALVQLDGQLYKVMPSNNLSVTASDDEHIEATSVVGPYRIEVVLTDDGRTVNVRR